MKCFYHSADLDGHCSGAIIKYFYPNCELIGINYGDEFPWDNVSPDETVYMVDFSLQPFKKMIRLNKLTGDFVWIDHHKSAIEEYDIANFEGEVPKIEGIQESGIGACALVWKYLSNSKLPLFIKLLAEYDVWDHSDERTLPFQWGMRQYDTLPENFDWGSLFNDNTVKGILIEGDIILKYAKSENEKYIKSCAFETGLDGLNCIACNKLLTNSMLFTSVWDKNKYDAMLTFGYRKGQWTVSLYSDREDIDVSIIAKNRGGGGHKGAAGFQCDELPFNLK